jgi:WD40 repeat protein
MRVNLLPAIRSLTRRGLFLPLLVLLLWLTCIVSRAGAAESNTISFSRDVAPILAKRCQTCHGPEKAKGKFRLDAFVRLQQPGKSKAAPIVAGHPDKSELYRLITSTDPDERMPQKADPLPPAEVQVIRRWIEQGAKFDGANPTLSLSALAGNNPLPHPVYARPVPITALAFSPDGSVLAAGGYHEITLWDPSDGRLLGRLQNVARVTQELAYSPDGRWLAAASGTPGSAGEVRLFDLTANPPASHLLDRIGDVMCAVAFSPDGTRLAAGSSDNLICIYEVRSETRELRIEQHADWVTDLAFSPDGRRLVSASRDKSCRVFDARTGAMESAYLDSEEPIYAVAWDPDGKHVYSAGRDRAIHAWTAADAKPAGQISAGISGDVFRLACAGDVLLAACGDGSVRAYARSDRRMVRAFSRMPDWVYSLAVDRNAKRVAAGCFGGEVRVWNLGDGREVIRFVAAPGYGAARK